MKKGRKEKKTMETDEIKRKREDAKKQERKGVLTLVDI